MRFKITTCSGCGCVLQRDIEDENRICSICDLKIKDEADIDDQYYD